MKSLITLASLLASLSSHANTTTHPKLNPTPAPLASPTPFVDLNPYQNQGFIRFKSSNAALGTFATLPAMATPTYTFTPVGQRLTQVVPNAALMFDKSAPVTDLVAIGSNYAVDSAGYLISVSSSGFFFVNKTTFKPSLVGGVYFTQKGSNNLIVIDSAGYFSDTFKPAPAIRLAGGNYFIDHTGVLTTIKAMGVSPGNAVGMVIQKDGVDFSDAEIAGGNFFVRKNGKAVTVSSLTGFYSDDYPLTAKPKFVGGNYYIGEDHKLYTFAADGSAPVAYSLPAGTAPVGMGYSFFQLSDGSLRTIDSTGFPHSTLIHVSATGTRVEALTSFPSTVDFKSTYVPTRSPEVKP